VKLDGKGKRFVADYTATGLRTVQLGTPPPGTAEPILWTNDHLGDEVFQLVSSGQGAVATDAGEAGGNTALADFALVSMELPLQYSVLDVDKYDQLAPPMMRDDLLKVTAQRELTRFFQTVTLDDVLGPRRFDLSDEIRRRINAAFDQLNPDPVTGKPLGAGVEIVFAGIVGVHPPKDKDIALSFEKVVEADQRYQARMDGANAEQIKSLTLAAGDVSTANSIVAGIDALEKAERDHADAKLIADLESRLATLLDAAGGKTSSKIADAKGDRWLTHMQARGRASEYIGQLKAYETSPGLYRANVYFDALKGMMANARVYITDPDVAIRAELQDKESNVGVFKDLTQDK
jgi:regulator of protease activity HflC (stomatin/prohibitin superfamily)